MRHGVMAVALAAALGLVASTPSSAAPSPEAQVRLAFRRLDRLVQAMQQDSIAETYVEDGEMRNDGRLVVRGRDSIRTFLAGFVGKVTVSHDRTTIARVTVRGDTAFVTGVFDQTATLLAENRTVRARGGVEAVWVRRPEGWRIVSMGTRPLPGSGARRTSSAQ